MSDAGAGTVDRHGNRSRRSHRACTVCRALSLAALATSLYPSEVQAQTQNSWRGGLGIFLGVSLSDDRPRFEMGGEAFGMLRFIGGEGCTSIPIAGVGPLLQASWVWGRGVKYTFAVHGGGELDPNVLAGALELGLTYRPRTESVAFRTGALFQPIAFVNVAARHDFGLGETFLGGGTRVLPTYGEPVTCVVGRPLRTEETVDEGASPPPGRRSSLGERWAKQAQEEYEASFAFLNLAQDLMAARAPDALVHQALDSAADELRHAALCTRFAKESGVERNPVLPKVLTRTPLEGTHGLRRLALEGLTDGFLNEGIAADVARVAAQQGETPSLRTSLSLLSSEEARHAKLGASVAGWALHADKSGSVREMIAELRKQSPTFVPNAEDDAFQGHGFVRHSIAESIIEQQKAQLTQMAARLVG